MAPVAKGLLDTSVFIARESGRPIRLDLLPERGFICPVTIAELKAGVLIADDLDVRARRMATLESTSDIEVLTIDEEVASAWAWAWARIRVHLAEVGRRVNVNDLWIAATAVAHGIAVVTQDDDFSPMADTMGLDVIRV